ncbi:MAG: hypothetical protein M3O36_13360, partial [Myxococcota bacterium]|nr:hypothetical protein [Myxococcota bacterium]
MDSSQIDSLVQRLVSHPHDEEALAQAHHSGASDPKSYALLLERVGTETRDPAYASHWLSEAANVWSVTLGDAHRAARVLMQAIDRDPTQRVAADRLAQLYRDKGDVKALVALLERRAKALAPLSHNIEIREDLGAMHEELGRLWSGYLHHPKKGLENFRRAVELSPASLLAIRGARELHKSFGQWDDAIVLSDAELALESDPQRRLVLLRERASLHRAAGDLAGASQTLALARQIDDRDPELQQEYGGLIVERLAAGEDVPMHERTMGAELLVGLAEVYDGEHGLAYSAGALDIDPGHDRALQLYAYYAHATQHEEQVTSRYLGYVQANPQGAMASDARWLLAASYEAAAQIENAVVVLEPLRSLGDVRAATKLGELYGLLGQPMPSGEEPVKKPGQQQVDSEAREGEQLPPAAFAPAPDPEPVDAIQAALDDAQALADRGQRAEAFEKYKGVLAMAPSHVEALAGARDHLRAEREYGLLRDILLAAAGGPGASAAARREYLREVADLCEGNLRDVDGAIAAYSQILTSDAKDEAARQALQRLFEKAQRWDELARLLEEEATAESDLEKKVAFEKKIALLHEQKRSDPAAAAEAWERIARLTPEDEQAIATASGLFERSGAKDRAARVIAEHATSVTDPACRAALLDRLGELREQAGDATGAGEAYAEA